MNENPYAAYAEAQQDPNQFADSNCQYWFDNGYYNLLDLNTASNSFYNATQSDGLGTKTASYSFCVKLSTYSWATCNGDYYAALDSPSIDCKPLSTDSMSSMAQSTYTDSDGNQHLALNFTSDAGDALQVGLICDSSVETPQQGGLSELADGTYRTTLTASQACSTYDLNSLIQFFDEYSYIWGGVMIVLGTFLAFFGRKLFVATIFITAMVVTVFAICLLFFTTFLKSDTEYWVTWIVLGVAVLLGGVAGFFATKLIRLGAAAMSGWGGFMLGLFLNGLGLYLTDNEYVFWGVCIGLALVCAIAGYAVFNHALIVSTSFAGSYLFFRGISLYAGGWPNEFSLIEEVESGAIPEVSMWFYLYAIGVVAGTVATAIVQFKQFNKMQHHEQHPYMALN